MPNVFISYSRTDIAFARLLHQALLDNDLETWIDWQDIPPSADWLAEVYEAIEQAETFIFIISETSVISEVCSLEIAHAERHNKRLIPIVINDIDPTVVPPHLAALNWIFFRDGDAFSKPLADLIEAIQVDQDWVKAHTRYLNRALEWERGGQSPSLLLRGGNLTQAERWLSSAAEKSPPPTPLHSQYILTSRQNAMRRQRITLIAVLGVLAISIFMGVAAWVMRNTAVREEHVRATAEAQAVAVSFVRATAEGQAKTEALVRATAQSEAEQQREIAEEESEVALSRQLAAQALNKLDQLDLALLLSVESALVKDTREGRSSLLYALTHLPNLQTIWHSQIDRDLMILATSMNSKYNAVRGEEVILVWDMELRTFVDQPPITFEGSIEALAISDDGAVAIVSGDEILQRWALGAEHPDTIPWERDNFTVPPDLIRFSPDAKSFALGLGETIQIWDATDGAPLGVPLTKPGWQVTGLAFSPGGTSLAAGYAETTTGAGMILIWDLASGEVRGDALPLTDDDGAVRTLLFHPEGSILASVGGRLVDPHIENKAVRRLWDLSRGEQIGYGSIFPSEQADLAFNQDGELFALRHEDVVEIMRWKEDRYRELAEFSIGHSSGGIAFTPEGLNLVTGSSFGAMYVWNTQSRDAIIQHPFEDSGNCMYLAFSPDASKLFTDCWLKGVALWDVATGERLMSHEQAIDVPDDMHDEEPRAVAYSPDGTRIASGYVDHSVVLWDAETLTPIGEPLRGNGGEIKDLAFSPDGQWLVAGSWAYGEGDVLVIWRASDGQKVFAYSEAQFPTINSLTFSPMEDRLAVGGSDTERKATIWFIDGISAYLTNRDTQPTISVAFEEVASVHLAFRQDGVVLASVSGQEIHFYDVETRQEIGYPYRGHEDEVRSLGFSPDGRLLASGSGDSSNLKLESTIILWDLQTGKPIDPPLPGTGMNIVYDLEFSPDGGQLASYSSASRLVLWDVTLESWQAHACQIANRNLTEDEWGTYLGDRPYHATCAMQP